MRSNNNRMNQNNRTLSLFSSIFPFLSWFENYSVSDFRVDFVAGLTVALVLIPQSMAYAQLAGLPAYYGLYAAFLPPMVAAVFGSSHQLATGPVAVVSLMTATALEPLATSGSDAYIAYAILLALMVGIFQFTLGVLRLGLLVNFLSHPVVNGFTNAAALIIASSQFSKLFGVYVDKAEHHYETVFNVARAAISYTHWPTLALAVLAFAIMVILKRVNPKIPNVLVAVVLTTLISYFTDFEHNRKAELDEIVSEEVINNIRAFNEALEDTDATGEERVAIITDIKDVEKEHGPRSAEALILHHQLELLNMEMKDLKEEVTVYRYDLRSYKFDGVEDACSKLGTRSQFSKIGSCPQFYLQGKLPAGIKSDGRTWRIKVGTKKIDTSAITFTGGGAVVGIIPEGLPGLKVPDLDINVMLDLFSMVVIISLLGFMEAISIAKAMAAKTGQRLDPNQELIGQGLANILGSAGQSYPVSGSFSRSAVNLQAGALTGLSNVISSLVVVITLMFFTPLLYHLPQSVLASIIVMAVIGLINVKGFIHAWHAQKYDGIILLISFAGTLAFAPHLDKGITIGVALTLGMYLFRNMKPDIALLSKHPDGSFRNSERFNLERCKNVAVIRFNGSLFFANVSHLEEKILEQVASMPNLKHILIVGNGINELDASGEEMLSILVTRMQEAGYEISLSGLNDSVLDVMRRTHLYEKLGEENLYRSVASAVEHIYESAHEGSDEETCPLVDVSFKGLKVSTRARLRPEILEGPGKPTKRDDHDPDFVI